ncbi:hypothetical protein H7H82_13025 [Mycobacterium heidelbergense]|uniref:Uncharacterized protein n=1 Tax=Mycobacterium heidelbergense TaxID=53376 RepID=A0A1X0DEH6_MYCHE|nr:AAA family ATPase [Mycobacterium heidelbergense]MCV7051507.1 hypothetical protein [Mycobacterium heidelbergense]ORA70737.1 hypothetical protein BST25_18285 [Mycobacterium heidelbergense]BBZ50027.1 hypothetical protein MHEI_17440 [Mycobacterium heidelbergense]
MSVGSREWDESDAADEVLGATGVWLIPRAPTMVESRCRVVTTDASRDAHAGTVLSREHQEVLEWAQARVDELIGVVEAKERFAGWRTVLQTSQHSGAVTSCADNHMVFLGAPGTAKRTFARVIGEVLFGLGTIARPGVTEVAAEDVVVGGLSRSAVAMKSVCDDARGGVLFIEEAYRLAPQTAGHSWGVDALTMLQTCMAEYRDELVVILAGYPDPMQEFFTAHDGLAGRFPHTMSFASYTPEEVVAIGRRLAGKENLVVGEVVWELLRAEAARLRSIPYGHATLLDAAGNAHYAYDVVSMCRRARLRRLNRLAPNRGDLKHLVRTDPGVLHVNTTDMQRALTASHPAVTT